MKKRIVETEKKKKAIGKREDKHSPKENFSFNIPFISFSLFSLTHCLTLSLSLSINLSKL